MYYRDDDVTNDSQEDAEDIEHQGHSGLAAGSLYVTGISGIARHHREHYGNEAQWPEAAETDDDGKAQVAVFEHYLVGARLGDHLKKAGDVETDRKQSLTKHEQ